MRRSALIVATVLAVGLAAVSTLAPASLAQNDTNDTNTSTTDQGPAGETAFTVDCDQLRCTFDAGQAQLDNGSIAAYSWDFGDGETGSGETVVHTYRTPGTYDVTLTLEDEDGDTRNATRTVTVEVDRSGNEGVVPWSALGVGGLALVGSIVISRMT